MPNIVKIIDKKKLII